MINRYIIFIFISSSIFSQTAFPGLDSWTHANSLGLAGGGILYLVKMNLETQGL